MTEPSRHDRARQLRALIRQRALRKGPPAAFGKEAAAGKEGDVHPDDVLARLDDALRRLPADEVGDPEAFRQAAATLVLHGEPAVRKLLGPAAPTAPGLSADELGSLEAIVIADGTRPSFLVRDGTYAADHPFLGEWTEPMSRFRPALKQLAACVGRLQVPDGSASVYNGTGTLVPAADAAEHLVLTNFHVVQHARHQSDVAMSEQPDRRLAVTGDWVIDFLGESGNPLRSRWRVKEVRLPHGVAEGFAGIDAAVLRIEPFGDESALPATLPVLSSLGDYALGEGNATLATIGFPGPPDKVSGKGALVDWNFVIGTLFNNRFGLKRVAPGRFKDAAGRVPGDTLGHVLSHDACTFGGASGSLVSAWAEPDTPAFALHFAGSTLEANYAVSLHKAAEALRAVGVAIR